MKDGKINKVFSDYDKIIIKFYYIFVDDIDKDKIIEIFIVVGSIGNNKNIYSFKLFVIISWYRWNGKEGVDLSLIFIS